MKTEADKCSAINSFAKEILETEELSKELSSSMTEPEWAEPIIREVLFLHNRTKAPRIKWVSSKHGGSGVTYKRGTVRRNGWSYKIRRRRGTPDIVVRVCGKLGRDKLVLLHELSHWLLRAGHHHDKTFWKKAWDLYFYFLTPEEIEEEKKSEFDYKGKALVVYQELTQK